MTDPTNRTTKCNAPNDRFAIKAMRMILSSSAQLTIIWSMKA